MHGDEELLCFIRRKRISCIYLLEQISDELEPGRNCIPAECNFSGQTVQVRHEDQCKSHSGQGYQQEDTPSRSAFALCTPQSNCTRSCCEGMARSRDHPPETKAGHVAQCGSGLSLKPCGEASTDREAKPCKRTPRLGVLAEKLFDLVEKAFFCARAYEKPF